MLAAAFFVVDRLTQPLWSDEELSVLESLWIGNLKALPPDPSNAYADDPMAAALGAEIFQDTRFSINGAVSCATCHQPNNFFQDGRDRAVGVGMTERNTPSIIGTAYSPWQFWDGRKDSQWAQALGPMESLVEHGGTRTQYAHVVQEHYRDQYEEIFGPMPDLSSYERYPNDAGPTEDPEARAAWEAMTHEDRARITEIYVNIGKAIAAFERTVLHSESRFDRYVEALLNGDKERASDIFTEDELAGLKLFIKDDTCTQCHNTPLFTNNEFSAIGTPPTVIDGEERRDPGRVIGREQVLNDEFNCYSEHSDAEREECTALRFIVEDVPELIGAFKVPSLRNVEMTGPYMHAGQLETLEEVMDHYNEAPPGLQNHTDLVPLELTDKELGQLVAFLKTLTQDADPAVTQH